MERHIIEWNGMERNEIKFSFYYLIIFKKRNKFCIPSLTSQIEENKIEAK
jgi:hypothetical protein